MIPEKTIERLSRYRRILAGLRREGEVFVYSHRLATLAGLTAAQVRRDLMATGYSGSPSKGYNVNDLMESVGGLLDGPTTQGVALVGVGNLGRAILAYFIGRRPKLIIAAAFDKDPHIAGRVICGCRCYDMNEMDDVFREKDICVGIVAVPAANAQAVAVRMVQAGACGILNFAPTALHLPANVHVENLDMAVALEKVAYFARQGR